MASLLRGLATAVALGSVLPSAFAAPHVPRANGTNLPVVDLGYELQQATLYNSTGDFYNFSNIRYAAPPVGNLRFSPPRAPAMNRKTVQTGGQFRICAQAGPAWFLIAEQFIPEYLMGQTKFNASSFNTTAGTSMIPAPAPGTTEDCLFLDVVVPKAIYDNAGKGNGAPVMVWIYGGGYTEGSKSGSGNPAGLIARSESNSTDGIIYVSMNYRLGAFGWLAGSNFDGQGGTPNVGLYDQRFALEWVQSHIAKFGGDPSRVTVFGESAGGGSIMHQITAYGGKRTVPFQQAIPQSPGWQPFVSDSQVNNISATFFGLLNVTTLDQARKLPFATLALANTIQVGLSPYGSFTYGPVVDGAFVPALPGQLLARGHYAKNLNVMVGHNADEGLLFTSPFVQNNSAFVAAIERTLPTVAGLPAVLNHITNVLYPPIFDGSQAMGYTDEIGRASALTSELVFTCNTFYLDKAFANKTYSYLFSVPPATHGEDIPYTYYNGPSASVISTPVALALQKYLTDFAETGSPNGEGVPFFPMYQMNATVQDLNITGISQMRDPAANARCDYWQTAPYARGA